MTKKLLFLLFGFLCGCAMTEAPKSANDSWLNEPIHVPDSINSIPDGLLMPVTAHREIAVSMLVAEPIVSLPAERVPFFVGEEVKDPKVLLDSAAEEEEAKAVQREKEAEQWPLNSDAREKFMRWAKEHRENARKLRRLEGKVKPYLVRGLQVAGVETGGFVAYQTNDALWISFQALGAEAKDLLKYPLVVFLEKKPDVVYVSTSMAR